MATIDGSATLHAAYSSTLAGAAETTLPRPCFNALKRRGRSGEWLQLDCIAAALTFALSRLIAIATAVLLKMRGSNWSFTGSGIKWSLVAGGAGAVGAFTLVLALGAAAQTYKGAAAAAVMPIVFGGAPIVNTIVAMFLHPPEGGLKALPVPFILGCLLAAGGAFLVAKYAPSNTAAVVKPVAPQSTPRPIPQPGNGGKWPMPNIRVVRQSTLPNSNRSVRSWRN